MPEIRKDCALITGASSGIGRECARVLAARGFDLVLVARREIRLNELQHELEVKYDTKVKVLGLDLTIPSDIASVYDSVSELPGGIDLLINNAGSGVFGAFTDTNWEQEAATIELNVLALTRITKLFLRDMISRGSGCILNVASTAALRPSPLFAVYAASKAYVLSFSEAIGAEVAGTGVTVTTLCPGPTETEFLVTAGADVARFQRHRGRATAQSVAIFGIEKALAGRSLVIPGLTNKFQNILNRLMSPRALSILTLKLRGWKLN